MASERPNELSLTRGGPLYRLLRRIGLLRDQPHDLRRVLLGFLALTWLPLAAIEVVVHLVTGRFDPVFRSPSVHARLLVAIPSFLVAERIFEAHTSLCLRRMVDGRLVGPEQQPALARMLRSARRRRDSTGVELVLFLVALAVGLTNLWLGYTGLAEPERSERSVGLIWYDLAALPSFLFLMQRSLWRWANWMLLLWRFSRLRLRLTVMHADRAGGLGFLTGPSISLAPFLFGASAVVCAAISGRVESGGAANSYLPEPLVLLVAGELLAFVPLLPFADQMRRARIKGLVDYGALGSDLYRLFHRRWIETSGTEGLLGTPDISSVADFQSASQVMQRMRVMPFDLRACVLIAVAALVPVLPLAMVEVPIDQLLLRLLKALA